MFMWEFYSKRGDDRGLSAGFAPFGRGARARRGVVLALEAMEARVVLSGFTPDPVDVVDVTVLDDGGVGFSSQGFTAFPGFGFQGDLHAGAANSSTSASYTVATTPGRVRLSATWLQALSNSFNTSYQIYDGANLLTTVVVNQQVPPVDVAADGAVWDYLGGAGIYPVSGNSLTIRVLSSASGFAIADAVRVERLAPLGPQGPQYLDDQDYGFASTGFQHYAGFGALGGLHAAGANQPGATASWRFQNVPVGAVRVSAHWLAAPTNATNTPVVVRDGNTVIGTFTLNQKNIPNDFMDNNANWENLGGTGVFFAQSGSVSIQFGAGTDGFSVADIVRIEPVEVRYADNGGPSFTNLGFIPVGGLGVGGSIYAATAEDLSRWVIWTFTDLTPGRYQIALTWPQAPNRSTAVPIVLYDGFTPRTLVMLNQAQDPNDFVETGIQWESLPLGDGLDVQTGRLSILMEDSDLGLALADVVRVERVL